MADQNYPTDESGKGSDGQTRGADSGSMGLAFDTGPVNEPGFRSENKPWGLNGVDTTTISVDQIFRDPFNVCGGAPNTGFAGGPGGRVVQEKNAEARPA